MTPGSMTELEALKAIRDAARQVLEERREEVQQAKERMMTANACLDAAQEAYAQAVRHGKDKETER